MTDYFHVIDEDQLFRYSFVRQDEHEYIYKRDYEGKDECGFTYEFDFYGDGSPDLSYDHHSNHIFLGWNLTDEQLKSKIEDIYSKNMKSLLEMVDQQKPNIKQDK